MSRIFMGLSPSLGAENTVMAWLVLNDRWVAILGNDLSFPFTVGTNSNTLAEDLHAQFYSYLRALPFPFTRVKEKIDHTFPKQNLDRFLEMRSAPQSPDRDQITVDTMHEKENGKFFQESGFIPGGLRDISEQGFALARFLIT